MSEFLGLAYFAEIPAVVWDIQRSGPSTGMPTRTQQGDLIGAAYASHGDTKHPLLFPSTPKECFDFATVALDLADRAQTPILVMSDLELGMNDNLSEPLQWDDQARYDRGKVLDSEALKRAKYSAVIWMWTAMELAIEHCQEPILKKARFLLVALPETNSPPIRSRQRRMNATCSV